MNFPARACSPSLRQLVVPAALLASSTGCATSTRHDSEEPSKTQNDAEQSANAETTQLDGESQSNSESEAQTEQNNSSTSGSGSYTSKSYLPPMPKAQAPAPEAGAQLRVLDWAGFTGAVTYTFDDSNSSQINNYEALQALGVPFTFYLQTGKSESSNPVWQQALLDGHELGNHTKSHLQSGDNLAEDTDEATTFIEEHFGIKVWTMAAPFGAAEYKAIAQERFLINRGVSDKAITPNDSSDPFNLNCFIPSEGAEAAVFNSKVDSARSSGRWQIMLVHGFSGGSDSAYQPVDLAEFTQGVEYTKSLGDMWVGTMVDVGAYWIGQKLFGELQPQETDGSMTWTWELPAHYPPGKLLRVTTNGGTLEQAGDMLEATAQGYFEVSMDVGTLTWNP